MTSVRKIAKSDYWLRHVCVCMAVRMEQLGSHDTLCLPIFFKSVDKIRILWNSDKNGYFTRTPMYIYDNISLSSSKNEKCFRRNSRRKWKHVLFVQQSFSKNPAVSEIIWKNTVQLDRPQIRHMRFESWITKATVIHSEYAILIAFTWQQWLRERATVLR
jgi:hypothetical protein